MLSDIRRRIPRPCDPDSTAGSGRPGDAPASGRHLRCGSIVVEMVVCSIMLGLVSLILVPSLHAVSRQRQAIRFDTLAAIELNNLHQFLLQHTASDSQPEPPPLSAWFHRRYPDARFTAAPLTSTTLPASAADTSGLQPLRLTIERPGSDRQPAATCSLVVWLPAAAPGVPAVPAVPESTPPATDTVPTEQQP